MPGELIPFTSREKKLVASSGGLSQLEDPQKSGMAKTSASSSLTVMVGDPWGYGRARLRGIGDWVMLEEVLAGGRAVIIQCGATRRRAHVACDRGDQQLGTPGACELHHEAPDTTP